MYAINGLSTTNVTSAGNTMFLDCTTMAVAAAASAPV